MAVVFYSREKGDVGKKRAVAEEVSGSVPKARRYLVFCDSPERLQELLDDVQYYDIKDTIVIPPVGKEDKPTVCVVMEDPDERTRLALERVKERTKVATSSLLKKTGALLEEWAEKLSSRGEQK